MRVSHVPPQTVEIEIQLSRIVMLELTKLGVDHNETLKGTMVKQEVEKMMLTLNIYAKLSIHKAKILL